MPPLRELDHFLIQMIHKNETLKDFSSVTSITRFICIPCLIIKQNIEKLPRCECFNDLLSMFFQRFENTFTEILFSRK